MEWRWDEYIPEHRGINLWDGDKAIAALCLHEGNDTTWYATYVEGGTSKGKIVWNIKIEAETLEEAKAVTIALMRMS